MEERERELRDGIDSGNGRGSGMRGDVWKGNGKSEGKMWGV